LEAQYGFTPLDIRTDYRFETIQQVSQVVLPLFDQEMLDRLVKTGAGWVLPENVPACGGAPPCDPPEPG
jgi:hypothetical protein